MTEVKTDLDPKEYERHREAAKSMYLDMGVARLTSIAQRYKVPKEIVQIWQHEDCWVDQRARHQAEKLAAKLTDIDTPEAAAQSVLKISRTLRQQLTTLVERNSKGSMGLDMMNSCTELLSKIAKVEQSAYDRLKL